MSHGKKFSQSENIKTCNESARKLLVRHGAILPDELQNDAQALIEHYDSWISNWKSLQQVQKPNPEDQFIFKTNISFPKNSEMKIMEHYEMLRKQCSEEI